MTVDDCRQAAATRDVDLALATLADDVVVRSPLTDRFTFQGKEDVGRLFETASMATPELGIGGPTATVDPDDARRGRLRTR